MRCDRGGQEPSVPAAHCKHIKILITHYETKNNAQNIKRNSKPVSRPDAFFFLILDRKAKGSPICDAIAEVQN